MKNTFLGLFFLLFWMNGWTQNTAQQFELFRQYNGRYNFTFIGHTLNQAENNLNQNFCSILASSSANLQLESDQTVVAAYLYWSGSGTGDDTVSLNGETLVADHIYDIIHPTTPLPFFSARKDITSFIQSHGNTNYTFADLDISQALADYPYCVNRTNYAGWSIVIVYEQASLPLNQLNVYDGFVAVPMSVEITLHNLNVIDQVGAQIGFIAWEGDSSLSINETLRFNGNILSNPPLNPANNAFNSTNSITGESTLYNMDMDIYPIENYIQPGDHEASITLTSGAVSGTTVVGDVVFISTVVSVLNSQMPDASIVLEMPPLSCQSNPYQIDYTIGNFNASNPLPITEVGVYVNGQLVDTFSTEQMLEIGESISGTYTLDYPGTDAFEVLFFVDPNNVIYEISKNNNRAAITLLPGIPPAPENIAELTTCAILPDEGWFAWHTAFSDYQLQSPYTCAVFWTEDDAYNATNPLGTTEELSTSRTVYVRVEDGDCSVIIPWDWRVANCKPELPNFFSFNEDAFNDAWDLTELGTLYPKLNLTIYNRWGKKVWHYNRNAPVFRGESNEPGILFGQQLPEGTYFVVAHLQVEEYPDPMHFYIYFTR